MKTYQLKIKLISPTLVGSGEGFGALIDTDIVFDDTGIPYIPSKRVKGCLLDSATDVKEMFERSKIHFPMDIKTVFGRSGDIKSGAVYFSNLTIDDYKNNKAWLDYLLTRKDCLSILSRERILETFTEIRQQTAIEDGVARSGSLRTMRLIRQGIEFYGDIHLKTESEAVLNTLLISCLHFRFMGTKRNRGFGEVLCTVSENGKELSIRQKLEDQCIV